MSEEGSQQHHPTDVFVSYRRTDREFVDSVVRSLEGRGVVVWWDADIEGGADWRGAIVEKLEQSQLMLLVFSEECNHSTELKKELALAGHFDKDVIPVLIEQTEPRGPFLYELAGRNWINIAPDAETKVELLTDRLVEQIDRPLQRPAPSPEPTTPAAEPVATPGPETSPAVERATPSWLDTPPDAHTAARADGEREAEKQPERQRLDPPTVDLPDIEAVIKADARPDRRDLLPFRWFDFIIPGLILLLAAIPDDETTLAESLGISVSMAFAVLALIGAIAFPVRYYRRRRSPYRVLAMLSLSNLVLFLGLVVGVALSSGFELESGESRSEATAWASVGFLIIFIVLSLLSFGLFWVLSKRRAGRELRLRYA
jgi:hypothetical protein